MKDYTALTLGSSALFGNELFPPELIKRATAPAWKDCPTGTIAYSHTGTNWTKQTNGWWRANGGDSFPTPGGCACLVRLPNVPALAQSGGENTEPKEENS